MSRVLRTIALLLLVCGCAGHRSATPWQASADVERDAGHRSPPIPAAADTATIVRVVDGDTFIARVRDGPNLRVRLIGVDTPETVKPQTPVACFGPVASAYAKHLLTGSMVRVAYEPGGSTDHYGRQLWDVWLPDGRFLAGLLVADGLGRAYPYRPQIRYAPLLAALQSEAKAGARGLWGPPCHGRSFSTPDHVWPTGSR